MSLFLGGLSGIFFISLTAALHGAAPTGILLDNQIIYENDPDGNMIGKLTAVDTDADDDYFYELVDGVGSQDNHGFSIYDDELLLRYEPEGPNGYFLDYEKQQVYSIRVRVWDKTDNSFDQIILLTMVDDETEDEDADGLNEVEEEVLGTSDYKADSDGDGFNDWIETIRSSSPIDENSWPDYPVVGWGHNRSGEIILPENADIFRLSTAQSHSLGLNYDRTVSAWAGWNDYGQIIVPTGLNQVIQVAAGGDAWDEDSGHSLALKSDGTIVAWGFDADGEFIPPSGLTGVVEIAAGRLHDLALKSDGTVVAWGDNSFGQTNIPEGLKDVVAISAGGFYSLALKSDGSVVGWGANYYGVKLEPLIMPIGLHDVVAISAGRLHSLALKSDGTVVAWGYGKDGQTVVPAGLTDVVAIQAGGFHSLALKSDGSVVAWGRNSRGQTTIPLAARSGVVAISAGLQHSLAIRDSASFPKVTFQESEGFPNVISARNITLAVGQSLSIQLGAVNTSATHYTALGLPDGLTIDSTTGVISGAVDQVVRGSVRIAVVTDLGMIYQDLWIRVTQGTDPSGVTLSPAVVMENTAAGVVVGVLATVDPDAGDSHEFELVDGPGSADNLSFRISGNQLIVRQRFDRDYEVNPAPMSIRVRVTDASLNPYEQVIPILFTNDTSEDFDKDGLTEAHELILGTSDTIYDCDYDGYGDGLEVRSGTQPKVQNSVPTGPMLVTWGSSVHGQLQVPAGLGEVIQVAAGWGHSMALKSNGTVAAWGWNHLGQSTVPAGLSGVVAVDAGDTHSLALKSDGSVVAWGGNEYGQSSVPQGLSGVVAISAGGRFSLALKSNGTVVAWGDNENGETNVPPGLNQVVEIAAGGFHGLALKQDGTLVTWGWSGSTGMPKGLAGVVAISAGRTHSVALKSDGSVESWSRVSDGELYVPPIHVNVAGIGAGWLNSLIRDDNDDVWAWSSDEEADTSSPVDAWRIKSLSVGDQHNVAIRQDTGFPTFVSDTTVLGWPGQTVSYQVSISGANPISYAVMGLPEGFSINPSTGLIRGTVGAVGVRHSVRVMVDTSKGRMTQIIWLNTVDGHAPYDITLTDMPAAVMENSPVGTYLGTLAAMDVDAGDTYKLSLRIESGSWNSYSLSIVGNRLEVGASNGFDYENDQNGVIVFRVTATDSRMNSYDKLFSLQLLDDQQEDEDGDGVNQAQEELFQTSDRMSGDFVTSDADHDGMPALIEHAFNLDAGVSDIRNLGEIGSTAGLPLIRTIVDGEGNCRLRLEYLRRLNSNMIYHPQFSSGMNGWAAPTAPVRVVWNDDDWERCEVDDTEITPSPGSRFGRVGVEWVMPPGTMGSAPVGLSLAASSASDFLVGLKENLPAGYVVANLNVQDLDPEDTHTYTVTVISGPASSDYFSIVGNQLIVSHNSPVDYETNSEDLIIRIRVTDSTQKFYEQNFIIPKIDDRNEDADGDGINEATEEDVLQTSDLVHDDFSTMDSDHDGIPALIEYAFNLDLLESDAGNFLGSGPSLSGLPYIHNVVDSQGKSRLRIEFLRRVDTGLTYTPQFSSSLAEGGWVSVPVTAVPTPINSEWERCVVDDPFSNSTPTARFGRVKISN